MLVPWEPCDAVNDRVAEAERLCLCSPHGLRRFTAAPCMTKPCVSSGMSNNFICRFAVGEGRRAWSSVWRISSRKGSLYCLAKSLGGEIKATIHPPTDDFPEVKRHWGFTYEAASSVAVAAKADGGRHKISWPGMPLARGCTLEWRMIFRGNCLCKDPFCVDDNVALVPIPGEKEQVEVVVVVGPSEANATYPRCPDYPTYLVAEGKISDVQSIWITHFITPSKPMPEREIRGKGYPNDALKAIKGELRAIGAGAQADGSLAFWDTRVERLSAQ